METKCRVRRVSIYFQKQPLKRSAAANNFSFLSTQQCKNQIYLLTSLHKTFHFILCQTLSEYSRNQCPSTKRGFKTEIAQWEDQKFVRSQTIYCFYQERPDWPSLQYSRHKITACNAENQFVFGSGRPLGVKEDSPLSILAWEKPHDRRAWCAT